MSWLAVLVLVSDNPARLWASTSCISRAIRPRSDNAAACACASRLAWTSATSGDRPVPLAAQFHPLHRALRDQRHAEPGEQPDRCLPYPRDRAAERHREHHGPRRCSALRQHRGQVRRCDQHRDLRQTTRRQHEPGDAEHRRRHQRAAPQHRHRKPLTRPEQRPTDQKQRPDCHACREVLYRERGHRRTDQPQQHPYARELADHASSFASTPCPLQVSDLQVPGADTGVWRAPPPETGRSPRPSAPDIAQSGVREPYACRVRVGGAVTRMTWWGHSTVSIADSGTTILTDPLLTPRLAHLRRNPGAPPGAAARQADAVLISHLHADHMHLPSLRMLPPDATIVLPSGGGRLVHHASDVREVRPGDVLQLGALRVEVVHAEHDGRRGPWTRAAGAALGYVVRGIRSVYFAGDTDLFVGMADLGGLDLALLPVGGWGPKLGPGHLDPTRAAYALRQCRAPLAIPIHYGTLHPALSRHAGPEPGLQFRSAAARIAPDATVEVLPVGGTLALAR